MLQALRRAATSVHRGNVRIPGAWARTAGTWGVSDSGAAEVIAPPENLNHKMCQTMAFGYSLFFKDGYLRPDLLKRSVQDLARELPPVAARVHPPKGCPGLRCMGDVVLDLNDAGVEFVLAESLQHGIEDLGPRTWAAGMANHKLASFPVPFYAEPFSLDGMYKGQEALFKVKLTRVRDGHILSVTVNHILADAGRALRLVERLGELYRSATEGTAIGQPLHFNSALETPEGFAAALEGPPPRWEAAAPDHGLTVRQLAAAPYRIYCHANTKYDMHLLYLPPAVTRRLKALAAKSGAGVSTMDAVQAFLATLKADLRGKDLVPTAPAELTVNVDLLHRGQRFRDPGALARHVGNAVHILHVPGVAPGTSVPGTTAGAGSSEEIERRLVQAVGMNAALIRRSVAEFRSDPGHTLRALERQKRMVEAPEGAVGAAFVVKGAEMKVASTTAVTAFPFDTVDFGVGPALYAQINYQPRFDWWSIVQAAQGYGEAGGVLCSVTLATDLQTRLVTHPAWRLLAPEAHLIVANPKEVRQRLAAAVEERIGAKK